MADKTQDPQLRTAEAKAADAPVRRQAEGPTISPTEPPFQCRRRTLAMRGSALATIGVSYFVLSGTAFGADIGIANPSAVAAAPGGLPRDSKHPQSLQRSMRGPVRRLSTGSIKSFLI
jgi:hypothetical protein